MARSKKDTESLKKQNQQPKPKSKRYKSVSRFVEVFEYNGNRYTIHPNSVVENLPEDAPQVQRLIKEGKLKEFGGK